MKSVLPGFKIAQIWVWAFFFFLSKIKIKNLTVLDLPKDTRSGSGENKTWRNKYFSLYIRGILKI